MFQRSLQVFVAIAIAVLAVIVGYALLRFRGPEELLAEAQAIYDRGEYLRVVNLLEQNEKGSVLRDPTKRVRLLRLRYAANQRLDNAAGALRDLEALLATGPQDAFELRLDQVRLLAVLGQGEPAVAIARQLLQEQPEHGRALELAGEANQVTYREELGNLFVGIDRDLGERYARTGRSALLSLLYRPDGDPEVALGLDTLQRLYQAQSRLAATWPGLQRRLQDLRARIQTGLGWYQKSLEVAGEPVAAMRGLLLSLGQAGRQDDLLTLCEGYRRRFHHAYVHEAGATAAWSQLGSGDAEAALATTLRWLPSAGLKGRWPAEGAPPALSDLLLARTEAVRQLNRPEAMRQLLTDLGVLRNDGNRQQLPDYLAGGLDQWRRQQWQNAAANLRGAVGLLGRASVPPGRPDLFGPVVDLRLEALAQLPEGDAERTRQFAEWIKFRPDDLLPHLRLARHHLDRGQPAAAMAVLDGTGHLTADDERRFDLQVATAALLFKDANQDGPALLAQCAQRRTPVPEAAHPLGYVLCAEAALAAGQPAVALASASLAIDKFPTARRPRLLKAKAELLAGRPANAIDPLQLLLAERPDDAEVALLLLTASRQANQPVGAALVAALRTSQPNPLLAPELLRAALADRGGNPQRYVPPGLPANLPLPELRILVGHAEALAGRVTEATAWLDPLALGQELLPPHQRRELAAAVLATLQALATSQPDAELQPVAAARLSRFGLPTAETAPLALAAALDLAATHPATAYHVLGQALAAAAPEQRNGTLLAAAGDLAARLGLGRLAADHWTAAMAFADGRGPAERLARVLLATDRADRAGQVFALCANPTDPALALRLGNAPVAERLARAALAADGADLVGHVVLASLGQPTEASAFVKGLADPLELLELCSLCGDPAAAPLVLGRAAAFANRQPAAVVPQLLLARALGAARQAPAAADVHRRLFVSKATSPMVWREIALGGGDPAYPLAADVAEALAVAAASGGIAGSGRTRAFSTLRTAEAIAAAGHTEVAAQLRTAVWLEFPDTNTATIADADRLAAAGRELEAFWLLLGRHERAPSPGFPELQRAFVLAGQLAGRKAPETALLVRAALDRLATGRAHGCLVHFVLTHASGADALDGKARLNLLRAHLDWAAASDEPGPWLAATRTALTAALGRDGAADAIDSTLAVHPTALSLWFQRAELGRRDRTAADEAWQLRTVLRHGADDATWLQFVRFAAERGALTAEDVARFAALPASQRDRPDHRLTAGLVALRSGRPDDAVPLLEAAQPAADGLHLQALGLALLQSRVKDALPRAAALFAKLAKDYPSSSRSRYAASFARQFAPR